MSKLVIVESPAKTHTIGKYLGSDYKVVSSKGHIRDLSTTGKYGLGVDVDNNFEPKYISIKGKSKDINALKKDVKNSEKVYLATDPDREGEAISWHLYDELKLKDTDYERVVFNEITEDAVLEAFNHTRKIDFNLVKSQETRRILDRIIGFRLSKFLSKKKYGKSAGRVQSVALKLIVDRENEINAFVPEEYWNVTAKFLEFDATLEKYNDDKLELHNEEEVKEVLSKLGKDFKIESVDKKEKNKKGVMPFITSTLQQACINKYNYNSSKTMRIAQKLYEGIDLGSETVGLITYMRTDSTRLSNTFISSAYDYISREYGEEYKGSVKVGKKTENVQDAHEAIRPTSIYRTPASVKKYLTSEEYKVYSIIYARALASLMKDAKVLATSVVLDNNNYKFKTTGQILVFDGYLKVYGDYQSNTDTVLPDFEKYNGIVSTDNIETEQKFTKPVARYTEATLIEEMEKLGIGRPSTYATIMETIKKRDYATIEDKKFVPTKDGMDTNYCIQSCFPKFINETYTAEMEKSLDEIADDKIDNIKILRDNYNTIEKLICDAENFSPKELEVLGTCPECGSDLVKRKSRYGEFIACSNYPKCKYTQNADNGEELEEKESLITNVMCPNCHDGYFTKKTATRGRNKGGFFYGCSNYPKCKTIVNDEPTNEKCPLCGAMMLKDKEGNLYCAAKCQEEKDSYIPVKCPNCKNGHLIKRTARRGRNGGATFFGCDGYPRCKTIFVDEPLLETCPNCKALLVKHEDTVKCSSCDYKRD